MATPAEQGFLGFEVDGIDRRVLGTSGRKAVFESLWLNDVGGSGFSSFEKRRSGKIIMDCVLFHILYVYIVNVEL